MVKKGCTFIIQEGRKIGKKGVYIYYTRGAVGPQILKETGLSYGVCDSLQRLYVELLIIVFVFQALFVFVVIGSAVFQIIQSVWTGGP